MFSTVKIDHLENMTSPDSHQAVEPKAIKCSDMQWLLQYLKHMYYTCMTLLDVHIFSHVFFVVFFNQGSCVLSSFLHFLLESEPGMKIIPKRIPQQPVTWWVVFLWIGFVETWDMSTIHATLTPGRDREIDVPRTEMTLVLIGKGLVLGG